MKTEEYRKNFMVLPFSLIINNNAENILKGFIENYREIVEATVDLEMAKIKNEIYSKCLNKQN